MKSLDRLLAVMWLVGLVTGVIAALPMPGRASPKPCYFGPCACLALTITTPQVKRVIDGDTYALYDVGITDEERIRVLGVDTPERNEPLYAVARDSTTAWLHRGPFKIDACHRDSFGRLLAWTTRGPDSLHVFLVNLGLGKRVP